MIARKLKTCAGCGQPSILWQSSPAMCRKCCIGNYKPSQAIKKKKPIKPISDKGKLAIKAYTALRRVYMKQHPVCEAGIKCFNYGSSEPSVDLHHKRGRGEYLLDTSTYLAVCRKCHTWIETHPKESKELGLSLNRLSKE